jgi:hypothetical protein
VIEVKETVTARDAELDSSRTSPRIASASAETSLGGTRSPFAPDRRTTSGMPPISEAITGAPQAIAWGRTSGAASSRSVGKRNAQPKRGTLASSPAAARL